MKQLILNSNVVLESRVLTGCCLEWKDGIITAIHEQPPSVDPSGYGAVIDAKGLYAAPGFMDLHVHGGGGYEFNLASPEEIRAICAAHARYGTTSILPTTLAAPIPELIRTIRAVREAQSLTIESNILGIHLEGPYFAQSQRGAQNPEHILNPSPDTYLPLLNEWDQVRMMGAAPELPGSLELGRELVRRGIVASIAHSDATYDEVVRAVQHGYSDVTHIYSGCSMVHRVNGYRVAGVVEAGLALDELTVQVIADGKHLPAALLKLLYKTKGADRIILITDALFAAASRYQDGDVITQSNGVQTVLEDGVMKLMDRQAFAGSIATANQLVRNMVQLAGASLPDAVAMASLTPARLMKLDGCKGRLAPGYDADFVLFDDQFEIRLTAVRGRIVFSDEGLAVH
ncbi:MAG: nagA 3 [Paenibacillaceae bacterium]|jgi:N-acetylglucosamine-6-phosphate deacetylase|nr:nagA 3 [Paenibacillaceae bacterium]